MRKKLGTYEVGEIVAFTLRVFGEGMKVMAEIALMAADAGLARTDELAVVIGVPVAGQTQRLSCAQRTRSTSST